MPKAGRRRPALDYLPFLTVCLYVVLGFFFTVLFLTNRPVFALLLTFRAMCHHLLPVIYFILIPYAAAGDVRGHCTWLRRRSCHHSVLITYAEMEGRRGHVRATNFFPHR